MLILVGESASGKSSIERELVKNYGYHKVTSYTTRSPRKGEINGIDYHFVSEERFEELSQNGFFAEQATYNGWHYGSAIEDYMKDNVVAVLTPHGLRQIKKIDKLDVVSIYINVPRRDRLIKILQRGDNIEEAYRRSLSDVGQFDGIEDEITYIIKNDDYEFSPHEMAEKVHQKYQHIVQTNENKLHTILCDIDEVVNNLVEEILDKYNQKYDDNLILDDITEYEIEKFIKPECKNIFEEFGTDDLLSSLDVQPKAKRVIRKLMSKFNFYFVTSTYPDHVKVKDKWLRRNFPQYNSSQLIVCQDKHLVHGDILIDDCGSNFIFDNKSPVKYNLIFDKPWNQKYKEDGQKTFRAHDWDEIDSIIGRLY